MDKEFTIDIDDNFSLFFEVKGYIPAREAPACSNPSDPRFADPGDPAEFDEIKVIMMCSIDDNNYREIPIDSVTQGIIIDRYFDEILDRWEE